MALPVYALCGVLRARGASTAVVSATALCLAGIPALGAVAWAWWAGLDPRSLPFGFVDAQLEAAVALARLVRDGTPFPWRPYLLSVWPYAAAGGSVLGGVGFAFRGFHHGSLSEEMKEKHPVLRDAGDMAQAPEKRMSWALPKVVGRGVVSLLSAPPGLGKGWWTWGMLRAMQDGGDFFGLPVHRPVTRPWWGRKERPLRVLWLTEEGPSFGETARRFGIRPGLVAVLQRQDVAATDWPTIVTLVRREAWRRGCAYVIVDTVRAWCPQAEQTNELAAEVFTLARTQLAAPGLGVLFVHHDRKGGGEYGEGVAGPNNLVGSTDVLIELKRVKGDPNARRMLVSRRFGDQDVTATLDGVRYVVAGAPATESSAETAPAAPVVPSHLQATLDAVRQAGPAGILRKDIQTQTGAAAATLSRQCRELRELGLIAEEGGASKNDPYRYRLVDEQPVAPKAPPPTSDPAYVKYLNSAAWGAKRREILDRADGACEECDAELEAGDAEVHHLTYERVGAELPEDLISLCPGCHRRAHAVEADSRVRCLKEGGG